MSEQQVCTVFLVETQPVKTDECISYTFTAAQTVNQSVCLSVFLHDISKTAAARITKLDV